MAKKRKIDPANVVWHAPETLHNTLPAAAERFSEALKDASPEDIIRAVQEAKGEYREYEGDEEVDGKLVPTYGPDRLQWVSDAPDDIEDGKGHFEVFDGSDDEYQPVVQRPKED